MDHPERAEHLRRRREEILDRVQQLHDRTRELAEDRAAAERERRGDSD